MFGRRNKEKNEAAEQEPKQEEEPLAAYYVEYMDGILSILSNAMVLQSHYGQTALEYILTEMS